MKTSNGPILPLFFHLKNRPKSVQNLISRLLKQANIGCAERRQGNRIQGHSSRFNYVNGLTIHSGHIILLVICVKYSIIEIQRRKYLYGNFSMETYQAMNLKGVKSLLVKPHHWKGLSLNNVSTQKTKIQ